MHTRLLIGSLRNVEHVFEQRDWAGLTHAGALDWINAWCQHGWPLAQTRLLPDPEEAHTDVVGHAWSGLLGLQVSGEFPWERSRHLVGWMCRVIRHRRTDYLRAWRRRHARVTPIGDTLEIADHVPPPDELASALECREVRRRDLTTVMVDLREHDAVAHNVLALRLRGSTRIDTALGLTADQVRYRMRVAREVVREGFSDESQVLHPLRLCQSTVL